MVVKLFLHKVATLMNKMRVPLRQDTQKSDINFIRTRTGVEGPEQDEPLGQCDVRHSRHAVNLETGSGER